MPPKGKGKSKGKFGVKGGKPMGGKTQGTNAPLYGLYNYSPGPMGSGFKAYCFCCGGLGHTAAECPSNKSNGVSKDKVNGVNITKGKKSKYYEMYIMAGSIWLFVPR